MLSLSKTIRILTPAKRTMQRRALITGITGQDGAYLAAFLLDQGYQVFGAARRSSGREFDRLERLDVADRVEVVPVEMCEFSTIRRALMQARPDEIYNLAAQSFVATSFEQPIYTSEVNAQGVSRLLEATREICPDARLYQASTSEMFGDEESGSSRNEASRFVPKSPYAVSKTHAHQMVRLYRKAWGMFGCSGILFNHESPLRGREFVTRKISRAAARISRGAQEVLRVGNLEARRDWGYAPEYVRAMHLMLQQEAPQDFVIATGRTYSVRDFIVAAFRVVGVELAWSGQGKDEIGRDAKTGTTRVEIDARFLRPADVQSLSGDASLALRELGWAASTSFSELVELMVKADLDLIDEPNRCIG